jgi:signal peptidase I
MGDIFFWSLLGILFLMELLISFFLKPRKGSEIKEWLDPAFIAVIIAAVLRIFFVQAFRIPSQSMEDTFLVGDQIMVNKCAYGTMLPFKEKKVFCFAKPKRGEVVIFRYPQDVKMMFVKRCIGLPGDTVLIKDKQLFINGRKIIEPYISHKDSKTQKDSGRDNVGPFKVPDGAYFMMGDNRDNSADSRFWGFLPEEYLRGKAWFVYWPLKRLRVIKHYNIEANSNENVSEVTAVPEK